MRRSKKARKARRRRRALRRLIGIPALIYGGLFAVFYYDLDGKLLYYFVEPFMKNHFDRMERRDPHSVPYGQIEDEYM